MMSIPLIKLEQVNELPTEVHGTFSKYEWSKVYTNSIEGYLVGDTKGRFYDGEYVYTSTVQRYVQTPIGDRFVITRNSTYKLED